MDINTYTKTFNNIFRYNTDADESLTFRAWHQRAKETRQALTELKDELDAELDGMKDTWAQRVIDEKRGSYADSFRRISEDARGYILADIDAVVAAKRARFSEALGDPGSEAVNVLALLNMRTTISAADIAAVVPKLNHSLLALQSLGDVARRHGITFPRLPDAQAVEDDLEAVREFGKGIVDSLSTPTNDLTYLQRLFWQTDFSGLIQPTMDRLDSSSFLRVDPAEIGAEEGGSDEPGV